MIPGDGAHGAAGICTRQRGRGPAYHATSANDFLLAGALPCRRHPLPMVLNVSARVSGPQDIRGDHSTKYTLVTGGSLLARDPQRYTT